MSAQFQFEIVSPEKLILSENVSMVTVPGGEGDFGVLAGHAPLITTVRPGVIEVYADNDNQVSQRFFVAGGFAEVTNSRCTVLAEEALPVSGIDRAQVEQQAKNLVEDLAMAQSEGDRQLVEAQLVIAKAKLQAVQ
ncbi:MAG: F0F1 ATP synthase subunit epsilon [Alphaproteobacteria bacterium]